MVDPVKHPQHRPAVQGPMHEVFGHVIYKEQREGKQSRYRPAGHIGNKLLARRQEVKTLKRRRQSQPGNQTWPIPIITH